MIEQIGLVHLRHTSPKLKGYPYLYSDFLRPVYVTSFDRNRPDAKVDYGYEIGSQFLPLQEVRRLALGDNGKVFLEAAVAADEPNRQRIAVTEASANEILLASTCCGTPALGNAWRAAYRELF